MRAVITRVSSAAVHTCGKTLGSIQNGLLVLLGVEQGDGEADIAYIVDKTIHLRIFEDAGGKMNLSLLDTGGALLLVSQFTLLGDCRKGRRPSFIRAGAPDSARGIYERATDAFRATGVPLETGEFQADMQVESVNDGPVTILLDSRKVF